MGSFWLWSALAAGLSTAVRGGGGGLGTPVWPLFFGLFAVFVTKSDWQHASWGERSCFLVQISLFRGL